MPQRKRGLSPKKKLADVSEEILLKAARTLASSSKAAARRRLREGKTMRTAKFKAGDGGEMWRSPITEFREKFFGTTDKRAVNNPPFRPSFEVLLPWGGSKRGGLPDEEISNDWGLLCMKSRWYVWT